jgi:hypothetical protein
MVGRFLLTNGSALQRWRGDANKAPGRELPAAGDARRRQRAIDAHGTARSRHSKHREQEPEEGGQLTQAELPLVSLCMVAGKASGRCGIRRQRRGTGSSEAGRGMGGADTGLCLDPSGIALHSILRSFCISRDILTFALASHLPFAFAGNVWITRQDQPAEPVATGGSEYDAPGAN